MYQRHILEFGALDLNLVLVHSELSTDFEFVVVGNNVASSYNIWRFNYSWARWVFWEPTLLSNLLFSTCLICRLCYNVLSLSRRGSFSKWIPRFSSIFAFFFLLLSYWFFNLFGGLLFFLIGLLSCLRSLLLGLVLSLFRLFNNFFYVFFILFGVELLLVLWSLGSLLVGPILLLLLLPILILVVLFLRFTLELLLIVIRHTLILSKLINF